MTTIHQININTEDRISQLESKVEKMEFLLHKLFGRKKKKTIDKSKVAFDKQMRQLIDKQSKKVNHEKL
jgi:hypothetical protein